MKTYYKHISIKDWQRGNSARYIEKGVDPMHQRIKTKYVEADDYRADFRTTTEIRYNYATMVRRDRGADVAYFYEKKQGDILMNLVMLDFYYGVPTLLKCAYEKMGGDTRRAITLIEGAIDLKLLVREPFYANKRKKILMPTVKMVVSFENRMARWFWDMALGRNKAPEDSKIIKKLYAYDALRKKHLPENISKQIEFNFVDFPDSGSQRTGPKLVA
ncbi:MAG: hypothetical protein CMP14_08510 [Rickettsiales bacterium]|nr:hypothetical protein [Rickettsiales bacterium]|tara:strand:+ start:236 stop:886 length:651 start_codon:yes stop_codon:yes gene_type:complete